MKTKTITRIFLCNKDERYDIENEIEEAKEKIAKGEIHLSTWSCGTLQELQVGDRVYFKRVGSKPHGFFAHGRIVAAKTEQTRLKSKKSQRLSATYSGEYPNLRFTCEWYSVVDYDRPLDIEHRLDMGGALLQSRVSGRSVPQKDVERFEPYWQQHLSQLSEWGYSVQLAEVYRRGQYQNAAIEELTVAQKCVDAEGYFIPDSGNAKRITASIIRRRGQPEFRQALLKAYNHQCAITNYDIEPVLEAAQIVPYLGPQTHEITNGLLLRADLHTLFDLYLITIDPETMRVLVAPTMLKTKYGNLNCRPLRLPMLKSDRPSIEALRSRCDLCVWAKVAKISSPNKFILM
jgi:hypothetical protein